MTRAVWQIVFRLTKLRVFGILTSVKMPPSVYVPKFDVSSMAKV